jgi:type I protein arginine methyltransferase
MVAFSCHDQSSTLKFHQGMIADRERVETYREAIHEVVEPGDVVVDLGTGTGLLAYFACQAGAARVYGIERGPVVRVAREMRRVNGFEDRVVFIEGESTGIELPEQADVLVSETLWNFGLGEGILGTIHDARARFLKPGGRVVPSAFEMIAAPVELPELYSRIALEPEDDYGLDFSVLRAYGPSNVYPRRIPPSALLAQPATLQRFDLREDAPTDALGEAATEVTRAGTVHGLAGWFSAELSPSVTLANPPSAERKSWGQAFLPGTPAVEVGPGARVGITVQTAANGTVWRWATEIVEANDSAVHRMDATTFFGFPLQAPLVAGEAGQP